ncbi:hypothetical protein SLEP1_g48635 [Rubroshorea leprosula]|uniref:Uncharacterized protein n=1 Tax=Rubroshorea leprosula TaxID=152421 RepID=A0AAV5LUF6_9ROSI|nr:hypothetical protein SLEP1_g48635 [Rubroshorea leprosula]
MTGILVFLQIERQNEKVHKQRKGHDWMKVTGNEQNAKAKILALQNQTPKSHATISCTLCCNRMIEGNKYSGLLSLAFDWSAPRRSRVDRGGAIFSQVR